MSKGTNVRVRPIVGNAEFHNPEAKSEYPHASSAGQPHVNLDPKLNEVPGRLVNQLEQHLTNEESAFAKNFLTLYSTLSIVNCIV